MCSEAADSGTINAICFGHGTTGSTNRVARSAGITAGTATLANGTTLAGIRRVRGAIVKQGTGTSNIARCIERYLDASNVSLAANGGVGAGAANTVPWNDVNPYLFVAIYRKSTTDVTTRTLVFEPLVAPPIVYVPKA